MSSAYRNPKTPNSLYPQVIESNPDSTSPFVSNRSSSSLYPSIDSPQKTAPTNPSRPSLYPSIEMRDLAENIFPEVDSQTASAPPDSVQETLITIPGAVVHLVDKQSSVELASGTLSIEQLRQGENVVAVIVHVGDEIQWPLTRDEASVKLDESHYFFSLHVPETGDNGSPAVSSENVLSYGVTFASKGQAKLLKEFDKILKSHSSFSLQKVSGKSEAMDRFAAKELAPADMASAGLKKKMMEERSAAYWTTIAPNVEDYSGSVAKAIAMGSGQLIKGILWCGDVTADRLNWGNDVLKKRMEPNAKKTEISPEAMRRMKRVTKVTRMSDKVANGVLSGVLKVSGFFTSAVVNSKVGKQFFGLMPGEIILATLDGFGRICDAAEFAGKNVLSTSSDVTTGLVSHKYGDEAAAITNESLSATGHALGTAWTFFKIRKAFNPKSTVKTSTLWKNAAKAVAAEAKTKSKKGKDRDQERSKEVLGIMGVGSVDSTDPSKGPLLGGLASEGFRGIDPHLFCLPIHRKSRERGENGGGTE